MPGTAYSDADLVRAVAQARSWRGVLRGLGRTGTSAAGIRSVRRRADALALDYSHFTGQRTWTETALADAVRRAQSWSEVATRLGLAGGSSTTSLRGHARRLGLETGHLDVRRAVAAQDLPRPDLARLPRSGSMLAAAWLSLCGYDVSWPLEPCRYDLLVVRGSETWRVQVKTTRHRSGGSWLVRIASGSAHEPYDPDEIDLFFVVDGDLDAYLIPIEVVGGLSHLSLSAYGRYHLGTLTGHRKSREDCRAWRAAPAPGT